MAKHNEFEDFDQIYRRLRKAEELPFSDLLKPERVARALVTLGVTFRERVYTPITTLWVFLSQVLSADQSCQNAIARLLAWRVARGKSPCSTETTSYCEARQRLPQQLVPQLTRDVARDMEQQADQRWLRKGRHVKIVDGSSATMADTRANQRAYPQSSGQKPGVGFPIARLVVIFSPGDGGGDRCRHGSHDGEENRRKHAVSRAFGGFLRRRCVVGRSPVRQLSRFGSLPDAQRGRRGAATRYAPHRLSAAVAGWACSITSSPGNDRSPSRIDSRPTSGDSCRWSCRSASCVFASRNLAFGVGDHDRDHVAGPDRVSGRRDRRLVSRALALRVGPAFAQVVVADGSSPLQDSGDGGKRNLGAHLLACNLIREVAAEAARKHGKLPRRLSFQGAVQLINAFATYLPILRERRDLLWERTAGRHRQHRSRRPPQPLRTPQTQETQIQIHLHDQAPNRRTP